MTLLLVSPPSNPYYALPLQESSYRSKSSQLNLAFWSTVLYKPIFPALSPSYELTSNQMRILQNMSSMFPICDFPPASSQSRYLTEFMFVRFLLILHSSSKVHHLPIILLLSLTSSLPIFCHPYFQCFNSYIYHAFLIGLNLSVISSGSFCHPSFHPLLFFLLLSQVLFSIPLLLYLLCSLITICKCLYPARG